jgi:hypothetical protein
MSGVSPTTGKTWERPEGDPLGLQVNQGDLGWITFDYMDCDSLAFSIGDRVVVQFSGQNWEAPVIIGFESHPKPCTILDKIYILGMQQQSTSLDKEACAGESIDSEWSCVHWRLSYNLPQVGEFVIYDGATSNANTQYEYYNDWDDNKEVGVGFYWAPGPSDLVRRNIDGAARIASPAPIGYPYPAVCTRTRPGDYETRFEISETITPLGTRMAPLIWPAQFTPLPAEITLRGVLPGRPGTEHRYLLRSSRLHFVTYSVEPFADP